MADIFTTSDAQRVIGGRVVWFFGDSNIRAIYKDLVWLLQKNTLIDLKYLKKKLEKSHMNDKLVKGEELHKGRSYTEVRCFEDLKSATKIEFTFITECLSSEICQKLVHLSPSDVPDVIVINSCLWDITRWGPDGVIRYKENVIKLLRLLKEQIPSNTLVIWTTTPPVSMEPSGGFLIKQINFMKPFLRFEVMEANAFLRREVVQHGFDLLDMHYHLLLQIHRRRPDGVHWNPDAVRHMTNLLLNHIALSLNLPLPGNFSTSILSGTFQMEINGSERNNNWINEENFRGIADGKVINSGPISTVKVQCPTSPNKARRRKLNRAKKRKRNRRNRALLQQQKCQLIFMEENYRQKMTNPLYDWWI